jgi:hypothetical protein
MSKYEITVPPFSTIQIVGGGQVTITSFSAPVGTPGLSAYQVAVANGFVGTEAAWLASLAAHRFLLYTTPKTLVEANRILLPHKPHGALLFNMALVYDADGVVLEYEGITVLNETGQYYACFNEPVAVTGWAVVSYLIQEGV